MSVPLYLDRRSLFWRYLGDEEENVRRASHCELYEFPYYELRVPLLDSLTAGKWENVQSIFSYDGHARPWHEAVLVYRKAAERPPEVVMRLRLHPMDDYHLKEVLCEVLYAVRCLIDADLAGVERREYGAQLG